MKISGIKFGFVAFGRLTLIFFICINIYSCKKTTDPKPTLVNIESDLLSQLNALRNKGCNCGTDSAHPEPRQLECNLNIDIQVEIK